MTMLKYFSKILFAERHTQNSYNDIMNWKTFYDQEINSDIKQYEQITKLTIGQGEYYTTGCLLDYDYIKNNYRLMGTDLSRQKELDTDSRATH